MSRTKNTFRNIIWGSIGKLVTIVLPFVTRTIMIYTMGMQYVGLGSLFTSLLQVLNLAELGIGSALVFSMYRPIAENDNEKICSLLNFYRKSYHIIGTIILCCGFFVLPFLNFLVADDIPQGISLHILFIIYLFNNVLGYFLFAYYNSLFVAHQRTDITSKISMGLNCLSSILQIIILICFGNYYVYVLVIPMITCLNNLCIVKLAKKYFPQYVCRGNIDKNEKRELTFKVGGMLFQKLGNVILTSVDSIVISAFLGLKILGIYNGYYYIITSLMGFLGIVQAALIPAVGNAIVTQDKEKNYVNFRKFHMMYCWIVIWWSSCLLSLYQPFIRLWQGEENMLTNVSVMLFVVYFFLYKVGDICWVFREAVGLWWQGKFVPLISSVVNLILNIYLVQKIGLPGIIISTIVSIFFVNMPFGGWVLFKHYFCSKKKYVHYLLTQYTYMGMMFVTAGLTWWICNFVQGVGIGALLIKMIICIIFPNLFLLAFNFRNPNFKLALQFILQSSPERLKSYIFKRKKK